MVQNRLNQSFVHLQLATYFFPHDRQQLNFHRFETFSARLSSLTWRIYLEEERLPIFLRYFIEEVLDFGCLTLIKVPNATNFMRCAWIWGYSTWVDRWIYRFQSQAQKIGRDLCHSSALSSVVKPEFMMKVVGSDARISERLSYQTDELESPRWNWKQFVPCTYLPQVMVPWPKLSWAGFPRPDSLNFWVEIDVPS